MSMSANAQRIRDRLNLSRVTSEPTAFYPPIEPFNTGRLRVSEIHELFYEEVGTPGGKPAVLLHGGPGAGLTPLYRQAFDPDKYHVVLFDQRGCGLSTPFGELRENTTWDIVADIEKLRVHLGIDRWLVFGGSWGATLALAYAQTHPHSVTELVLRGIWLSREADINFDLRSGASWLFPEEWDRFVHHIPPEERSDLLEAYYRRLCSEDEAERQAAAKAWGDWESCRFSLLPNPAMLEENAAGYADVLSKMECHYVRHRCWLSSDTQLIDDVEKIRHIPTVMVFGRYDVITPLEGGWALKKVWPEAELIVIPDEGHAFNEPGIARALVAATDCFAE